MDLSSKLVHTTSAHKLLDGNDGSDEDGEYDARHKADVSNTPAWHLEIHFLFELRINETADFEVVKNVWLHSIPTQCHSSPSQDSCTGIDRP